MMLSSLLDKLWAIFVGRRRVRVRTHWGYFDGTDDHNLFVTITNLSASRIIVVTHVYLTTTPQIEAALH